IGSQDFLARPFRREPQILSFLLRTSAPFSLVPSLAHIRWKPFSISLCNSGEGHSLERTVFPCDKSTRRAKIWRPISRSHTSIKTEFKSLPVPYKSLVNAAFSDRSFFRTTMTHFTSPAPGIGNSVPEAVAIDPTVAALHAVREAMQQLETAVLASRTSGQQVAPSTAINQPTVSPPLNYLNARVPTTAPSPGPPTFGTVSGISPVTQGRSIMWFLRSH
ncbi:hypothetical protein C8R45DRAFT_960430, partial [Mycena sanguinolenta]